MKKVMQDFWEFCTSLSNLVPDDEVAEVLGEYFSVFGAVSSATRFSAIDKPGRRYFLVQFECSADAIKAASRCQLRSFAFNGVLVELCLSHDGSN